MSSRSIVTLRMLPDVASEPGNPTLIDRYAGRSDHAAYLHYGVPDQAGVSLRLVDTSVTAPNPTSPSGHTSLWHLLWIRDEGRASATIFTDATTETWPIAAGDSLLVPPAATLSTTGDQLALAVSTATQKPASNRLSPPTHGTELFFGYNRQTTYPDLDGVATARWKITQPLDLSNHHTGAAIVMALAGDPALATPTESMTLRRGQAALTRGTESLTVYPNGLAYLFVITGFRP